VLLVDDDEVNLLLTALALRERGFEITEADQRRAGARTAAFDWTPDIIVLDAMMPGLDGFDTCRALRGDAGLRERAGADAHRPGRRRLDHPRLRGRRHRLLRQGHAVEPAGRPAALPAARLAHAHRARAQQGQAGARAGPGAHGQLRLARATTATWLLSPEACACSASAATSRDLRACCAWCRRRAPRLLRCCARVRHSSVLATDVPVTLFDGRQRIIHVEAEPEFNEHGQSIGYTGIVQDVTDRRRPRTRSATWPTSTR
jgi:CheY-like chemotaxis protein